MSTNNLVLIPTSPGYTPNNHILKNARLLARRRVTEAGQVSVKLTEEVVFYDPGENFESITCPVCHQAMDDFWWQKKMDRAYQTKFTNLYIRTPCCDSEVSLNELRYHWPAGFARFAIVISEPEHDISLPQLAEVEKVIGCPIRKIWARY
jgi:hypothetical protein